MKQVNSTRLLACLALTLTGLATAGPAGAVGDLDIRAPTGDVVAKVAQAARGLHFGKQLPGDVEVTADKMAFDYKQGTLIYTGHVRVIHNDIRLRSDRIDVLFEPGHTNALRSISANGHVEVVHGKERATGNRAVYQPGKAMLVLTGNARLGSGPHRIEGERVVVYLDEGRAVIDGGAGGRVRARIVPKKSEMEGLIE